MRRPIHTIAPLLALGILSVRPVAAGEIPLHDWPVPAAASPIRTLTDATTPLPFIGLPPCRIVDTRGGAPLGGGYMTASIPRSYTLTGQCGIPSGAAAVSLNITVTTTGGPGYVSIWPQGGVQPVVSTLNYLGSQTIANAAIVPLSGGGGVSVACMNFGCDLIVDTNGYFSQTPAGGDGIYIYANTGGYAIRAANASTTCTYTCGIFGIVDTQSDYASAVGGQTNSTSSRNYAVYGKSSGTGTAADETNSAGVYGEAIGTGSVYGVLGKTSGSGSYSSGVTGIATGSGQGGFFRNTFSGVNTLVAGNPDGISTNAGISAASLVISGAPKSFISPHPEDPSKEINYVAAEGPSADVFFRGTARLVDGAARIEVPDHFRLTAREGSYLTTVTPVGRSASLWVESEGPDGIVVRGAGDAAFHYVVWAERDEVRDHQPVQANVHFTPEAIEKLQLLARWPERTKALLVRNGTLEPDGTYSRRTAQRMGWAIPAPLEAPPVPVQSAGAPK